MALLAHLVRRCRPISRLSPDTDKDVLHAQVQIFFSLGEIIVEIHFNWSGEKIMPVGGEIAKKHVFWRFCILYGDNLDKKTLEWS